MNATTTFNQRSDLYTRVTERVVADLERGARPWLKPWTSGRPAPVPRWHNGMPTHQRAAAVGRGVDRGYGSSLDGLHSRCTPAPSNSLNMLMWHTALSRPGRRFESAWGHQIIAIVVVIAFAIIAAQLLVVWVESFIVIGAGVLFLGFAGSRWTKFFTERYLSYVASIGVKLFVLYLIMGVGMSIAARWMPILERGGFSPIPFFYVMGGSLVFVFLTWHIPSVAGSMNGRCRQPVAR